MMTRTSPTIWNDAQLAKLRELVSTGLTDTEIGVVMGNQRDSIRRARHRYGIQTSNPIEARIPADFHILAPTMTLSAAAIHYKRHRDTIGAWHDKCLTQPAGRPVAKPKVKVSRPHGGTPWAGVVTQRATIDDSVFGEAQRTLQRWGPVYKVSTVHERDETGDYIVWHKRMSAEDMVALAETKIAA